MNQNEDQSTYFARLLLHGDYDVHQQFVRIITTPVRDEDEQTWTGVDEAIEQTEQLLRDLDPNTPGLSDLNKIDFEEVDYAALVLEELDERLD